MLNACCIVWKVLAKELNAAKTIELNRLMEEHHLPESLFAGVLEVLGAMHNHCAACGSNMTTGKPPVATATRPNPVIVDPPPAGLTLPKSKIICPACKGRDLGDDDKGIPMKCARCLGKGRLDNDNMLNDPTIPKIDPDVVERNINMQTELAANQKPIAPEHLMDEVQ